LKNKINNNCTLGLLSVLERERERERKKGRMRETDKDKKKESVNIITQILVFV